MPLPIPHVKEEAQDYDVALECLQSDGTFDDSIEYSTIIRKIDLHIMPIMCLIYFFQNFDKGLLNYSAVMGIKDNLKGNEFANLGTVFNAAFIVGEPISAYLLQRYPLAKTFGACVVGWAITVSCHSACHTYAELMVVRVLLGLFEAATVISLMSISGMFYTKAEQSKRIGIWASMAGLSSIIGGILSFGFQHIHTKEFQSWQILFLVFGIITLGLAIVILVFLPDNLATAKFLTHQEKSMVVEHIRSNQTGVENKKFKKYQIKELLIQDKLTWLMVLLTICSQIVTGAVGTFSSTVVASFGFSNEESALLLIPIGVIVMICCIVPPWLISRYGHYTIIHISMYVPSVAGGGMMLSKQKFVQLFGLYLLYPGSCAITLLYIWNGLNTAGYTKRVFRNSLTMISFGIASIIGPQLFQANTAPHYVPAKITILATQAAAVVLSALVGYICYRENLKRIDGEKYEFNDATDIENRAFKYSW